MSEIDKLRNALRRHDYFYYVLAEPEVSDYAYDMLFKQLEKMEQEHPDLVTPDSPTQCVGGMSAKIYMKANNIS
jgi:DNA ligase (NAD+)